MSSSRASSSAPAVLGRPRSLKAKRAVLDAARTLVEKGGYHAASIEAIAARSGVAKTTIYRWWPNRPALMVDLLVQVAEVLAPPPQDGDPLDALRTELRLVSEAMDALPGRLLISVLGEAQQDPDIHRELVRRLFNPRRSATAHVIQRAQAAGAIRKDVPALLAVDLLYGPLFYRTIILHQSAKGAFVKQMAERVLAGLLAHKPSRA